MPGLNAARHRVGFGICTGQILPAVGEPIW